MLKSEIDDLEQRADRINPAVMAIGTGTILKLIAYVRRLERVRDAAKQLFDICEHDLGMDKTELTMLRGALKACDEGGE